MDESKNKEFLPLSMSVLLGSIIIAGSLIYGSNQIIKALTGQLNNYAQPTQSQPTVAKVVERKDAPKIGNGKIQIVEFADFQCPYCQQFYKTTYPELKAKYIDTGKATLVYRHFPLTNLHQNAQISAEAAECASRQGKFAEFYNILFTKGDGKGNGLNSSDLQKYALDLGLDTTKFNTCLFNGEAKAVVAEDLKAGQAAGVSGTPSFIVNGKLIVGAQAISAFDQAMGN